MEALERAGKMQGTNVPAGTKVPFPTGTFVPVKKTFFIFDFKK
jgi:hypothetical protein